MFLLYFRVILSVDFSLVFCSILSKVIYCPTSRHTILTDLLVEGHHLLDVVQVFDNSAICDAYFAEYEQHLRQLVGVQSHQLRSYTEGEDIIISELIKQHPRKQFSTSQCLFQPSFTR